MVLILCAWCSQPIPDDDPVYGEDGNEPFCTVDCRNEAKEDAAINRAEARWEAYA